MSELPTGLGRFDAGELTFEVDDGYTLVPLEDTVEIDEQDLAARLKIEPLASWMLARLAKLCGGNLALDDTIEVCEGALYIIDFVVRKHGAPIGKVQLQAGLPGAALLGVVSSEQDPRMLVDLFVTALVKEPKELSAICVRSRDPSWPEDRVIEYGWNGEKFF